MLPEQRPFAVITSLALLGLIVWLIRRRRLREEYALLWLGVGIVAIVLALWYSLLEWLTRLIGAVAPTTTLFIFAILFLSVVSIHYSISLSRIKDQVRDREQLRERLQTLRESVPSHDELMAQAREQVQARDRRGE